MTEIAEDKNRNGGPLKGVRITEFTSAWAGPYATCLLGFLGAEVIKVESKTYIDHSRYISFTTGKNFTTPNESSVFNTLNLNKKSVTLNLKAKKAIGLAKKLVKVSDAVIENMRPGVITRLGLGYDALKEVKEDLIYLSSSACGQTGPHKGYMGYAPTFASLAGLPHITGYEDWPPSNFMGSIDLRSATTSAFAILAALLYRQRTGEGQYMDLSSTEAIAALSGDVFLDYIMNNKVQTRKGNRDNTLAPHNCYRCSGDDKWISIAVSNEEEWQALCRAMGRPDLAEDAKFAAMSDRWQHQDELDELIGEWTGDKTDYQAMALLQDAGVAAAPSMSAEALYKDPHLQQRGIFMEVEHPVIGTDTVIAPPWKLSETPAAIHSHAPLLGQHNEEIFCGMLGMSPEEVKGLEEEKVIY